LAGGSTGGRGRRRPGQAAANSCANVVRGSVPNNAKGKNTAAVRIDARRQQATQCLPSISLLQLA
jgi:hypothetical protein